MPLHLPRITACMLLLLAGCATPGEKRSEPSIDSSSAPMRTSREHRLTRSVDAYSAVIPYSYTNRAGVPLYLVNCNGDVSPALQKLDGGKWVDWWIPATNACLSPPVVIQPGGGYSDTLHAVISPSDGGYFIELVTRGDTSTYRLIWHQALRSFDPQGRPFGEPMPIEQRVSNPFKFTTNQ